MNNIYDIAYTGLGGGMYRSWVGIDDKVTHRPARLENWPEDDLLVYVGGPHAKEYYASKGA